MKVVFSNYDDLKNPYYGGGGARAIHEIARRLAERHQVRVLTGAYPGCRDETLDKVEYIRTGPRRAGPMLGQLLFHFSLPWRLRHMDFDVWVESLTPPFSTACLQLFTRKPVVFLTQILAGKAMTRKYHLPFHLFERVGLKTYRYGIALSEPIRSELLREHSHLRIEVIPNGVDESLIEQPVEKDEQHILFLGRIDVKHKGLDMLLDAYEEVAKKTSIPLVIAGGGNRKDEQFLVARIREKGMTNRVRWVHKVAGEEKAELFRKAMFLVMPSRFEGLPLTLLEAFCWELPVVLYAIDELSWVPESCSVKVPPFDVKQFAAAMLDLAADSARRKQLGTEARQQVRAFAWGHLARQYEVFLKSLVATPATSNPSHAC